MIIILVKIDLLLCYSCYFMFFVSFFTRKYWVYLSTRHLLNILKNGFFKKIWHFFETLITILFINKMFSKGCMKILNAHILSIKISEKQQCAQVVSKCNLLSAKSFLRCFNLYYDNSRSCGFWTQQIMLSVWLLKIFS